MLVEKMIGLAVGELHSLTELKGLSSFASDPVLSQLNGAIIFIPYSAMIHAIVPVMLLNQQYPTLYFPTNTHNVKKRRVIKTF